MPGVILQNLKSKMILVRVLRISIASSLQGWYNTANDSDGDDVGTHQHTESRRLV